MQTVLYIIGVLIFIGITVDVWRSPAGAGKKIIWTIAAAIFTIITLVVWLVWGRRNAYGGSLARR